MIHFEPKRILCAVDLSHASTAVLSWARLLAGAFAATVEVVYANWSEPPRYFTEGQVEDFAAAADAANQKLHQDLDCLAGRVLRPGITHETRVEDGHAVEVILANIASHQPDLILLGSHGHSGVSRLLIGSVAENVVRQAPCPVLVVKGPEVSHDRKRLQHVVCPVNLTEVAADCAAVSSALAEALDARLDIIQSVEGGEANAQEMYSRLCEWVPEGVRTKCHVSPIVRQGDAAEQVILFAREHDADLIVVGAEHRPFLEFTVLGRTTERVMRHSPCSVLVVPWGSPAKQ